MYRKIENHKIATTSWTFHTLLFRCILLAFLMNGNVLAIEEPKYEVALSQGEFELRRYAPHIIAATYVDGNFSNVGNEGFRRLAGYIFGGNRSRQQISMTAPVTLNPQSEKIAMTAPVSQQSSGKQWRITFTMPASYTIETLPIPQDSRVKIQEVSERLVATLRYSGSSNNASYQKKERMLLNWIRDKGWIVDSSPAFARYDAPYVPWFLRRNEILIEVAID